MSDTIPVASRGRVRAVARRLISDHRRALAAVLVFNAISAIAGLVSPYLVGRLVDLLRVGTDAATVSTLALGMLVALVVQAGAVALATRASILAGEAVFAELREDFMTDVLELPISTLEHSGTGDLLTRTTSDVDAIAGTVRYAIPQLVIAVATIVLVLVAAFLTAPLVALGLLVGAPIIVAVARWYLKRATPAYLAERASYGPVFGAVGEDIDGARTLEALQLGSERRRHLADALAACWTARRRVISLTLVLLPVSSFAFGLPLIAVLLWGGILSAVGLVTAGGVATIALYAMQLVGPVDVVIRLLDDLQQSTAAGARILGVGEAPNAEHRSGSDPADEVVRLDDVRYAYPGRPEVLHGISLDLVPGERLAIVGPSGSGKSTLARILAGIDPPSGGNATIGGVALVDRPLAELRREVALVTQEHHVFVGTVGENLRIADSDADDTRLRAALSTVDALDWVDALPHGLDTVVGSGGEQLSDARAQELALARLVLADPHTLVLDEATSLLDGLSARRVERALSAVLEGRTVVAIAHRLHTAFDADRIAVVEDGRIVELGSHDELRRRGGAYAGLWRSWSGAPSSSHAWRRGPRPS